MNIDKILEDIKTMSPEDLKAVSCIVLKEIVRRMYEHRKESIIAKKDVQKMKQELVNPIKNELTLSEAVKIVLTNSFIPLDKEEIAKKILSTTTFKTQASYSNFVKSVYHGAILPLMRDDIIRKINKKYAIKR